MGLRVVHLIPTLKRGGAERFALDIALSQDELPSIEAAHLLVMYNQQEYQHYPRSAKVQFIGSRYLPSISGRSVRETENYRAALSTIQPHVIHTHLFGAELLSAACLYPGALYITHCHDNMVEFARLSLRRLSKLAIVHYYERSLLMVAKYRRVQPFFVVNSADTLAYFKRVLPRRLQGSVQLIPYGFDFSRFFDPERSRRLAASTGRLTLTMVASFLAQKKNQEFLVDVASALKNRGVAFGLNLVGEGPRREQVEAYARLKGVADRIRFWGLVANVEEVLWESDVYVHSATYEPFGLVFLEAMAAGLPCVALDGRGNRDVVKDGHNGFLLSEADPGAFAERILEVAVAQERYVRMSRNAVATARSYDIARCAERLVSFYGEKLKLI